MQEVLAWHAVQLRKEERHQVHQKVEAAGAYIAGLPHIGVTWLSHSARCSKLLCARPYNEGGVGSSKWMGSWITPGLALESQSASPGGTAERAMPGCSCNVT